MPTPQRTFIPFDRWLPDAGKLNNPGLRRAWGVVPFYGNYVISPPLKVFNHTAGGLVDEPFGFHMHSGSTTGFGFQDHGYYGSATKLYRLVLASGAKVDMTRSVGGSYAFGSFPSYWNFHSFGDNIIATNLADEVQYLPTPSTANFADMITSDFKPQWRFTFSIGQNLFGAACVVPANYDTLTAGNYPQLVVWSQNRNVRAFGSENADPQLVGAGYNPLLNDFGPVTGVVGGGFGIVFQRSGHVRIDGPPYEFDARPEGGTVHPDSIVRVGNDIYFWGTEGPSVLRNGNPPVVVLTQGRASRSMLDVNTGFSEVAAIAASDNYARIRAIPDRVNGLVRWSYYPGNTELVEEGSGSVDAASAFFDYNYREDRIAVSPVRWRGGAANILGLGSSGPSDTSFFGIFVNGFGILIEDDGDYHLFEFDLDSTANVAPDAIFKTPLGKLSEDSVTRILRVRPIYAQHASHSLPSSVVIESVNDPREPETVFPSSGSFAAADDMGWIVTPDTQFADYHSVQVTIAPNPIPGNNAQRVFEIEGMEIEWIASESKYGA